MKEKYTPYLKSMFSNDSIKKQYLIPDQYIESVFSNNDPLSEDTHQPVPGLIHKYNNRALIKMSYRCAAHCRFCTRIRQIGTAEGDIENIDKIITYISSHKEITDVILSGGDPFYTPKQTHEVLNKLSEIDSVKVIRVGTRLPVHNPDSFNTPLLKSLLDLICKIEKPIIILIHFEHPDELTEQTIKVIKKLKQTGATILSQTVFLNGINNNKEILKKLFETLYWNGVIPYYIYRCDYVAGLENFVCDINQEVEIMTELRKELSGIAYPTYIIDVEGHGKIPVPLNFWSADLTKCTDFLNNKINV